MKTYLLRGIFLLLSIMTAIMIFSFSAESGEESGQTSGKVTDIVLSVSGIAEGKSEAEYEEIKDKTSSILRVLAHFSEYLLFGVFVCLFLSTFQRRNLFLLLCTMAVVLFYAALDEWHQYYVPGRSADILDVLTDASGGLCGSGAVLLVRMALARMKEKQNQ